MFVAGADGCRGGWVCFKVEVSSLATSLEVLDLPSILKNKPPDLVCIGIDIPIGLRDGFRACDKAAPKLLGQLFAAPCRTALQAETHAEASMANREKTLRSLSRQ